MRRSRIICLLVVIALLIVYAFEMRANTQFAQDTVITLERTACYGFCPVYKLMITADGTVTFKGKKFVKHTGEAKSKITEDRLRELLAAFEKINFFRLRNRYEDDADGCKGIVTDHPSAITSITINGKSKSVKHYHGCRGVAVLEQLMKLEQQIDDAVNSSQWIR